jgi:competence protein ComFC
LAQIVDTVSIFLRETQLGADLIIPMPPSNSYRRTQPVVEITRNLGSVMKIALSEKGLLKVKNTPQLKNVYELTERERILSDAFAVARNETRGKKILLMDDLYRSGATMNAAAREIRASGEIESITVLALTHTRKHK